MSAKIDVLIVTAILLDPMSPDEMNTELDKADARLAKENAPLHERPFKAFRLLANQLGKPGQEFELFGPGLFQEVHDWYVRRYGQQMTPEIKLGEKPILIRGGLYFLRYPVVFGSQSIDMFQCIQGVTPGLLDSLAQQEMDAIATAFERGYEEVAGLEGMKMPPAKVTKEIREIISRGRSDIASSLAILKNGGEAQETVFHAHGAAEKFMKAALAFLTNDTLSNVKKQFGKSGHDLQEGLQALTKADARFATLGAQVVALHLPDMKIRYEEQLCSVADAVRATNATFVVCAFIAKTVF